ncbi:MAG: S9 family peptidase, partial [Gemmatimonadota bacterium]|nr:S9 family peptidase [Gemmatimonadota bacterium]
MDSRDLRSVARRLSTGALLSVLLLPVPAAGQDVLTPELLWSLRRVSSPAVSPGGDAFVYGVTTYDIAENGGSSDLWLRPVAGGEPHRLTEREGSKSGAAWRPDGEWIGFLAATDDGRQWFEVRPDGSGLRQVTVVPGGIANVRYAPDGRHLAFTRDVKLDPTPADIYPDLPEANARIIDDLMYRHWDAWHDYAWSHLFVAPYEEGSIGEPVDLMPGERHDTPLAPFGGVEQIAWHPDGRRIAYTAKKLTGAAYAVSTNSSIYLVDIATGTTTDLVPDNPGYDVEPAFSPDGRRMAWLSMARDGYEADRNRLFVLDLESGERTDLSAGYDNDLHGPAWSPDGSTIWATGDTRGTLQVLAVDARRGGVRQVTDGPFDYTSVAVGQADGRSVLVATRRSISAPVEIFRVDPSDGAAVALTDENAAILGGLSLGAVEKRMVPATDGEEILTWVIYPPDFDPSRRWPVLLYAQGGPQGTVSQFFSYRWNFQLMAANGYVVVAPNRRGTPSFGQAWKEQISGDWGGQAMRDLLSAVDHVAAEPWADEDRMGAVGASFGGYSVYWLAGNHEERFRTFIAHAGVFNLASMYGATEELFFVNFDLGGPYWERPASPSYERFSPHRFVQDWDTPILVIHGQKDFRVPVTEGMQAFTAARAQGIDARFLYFPEEGHWILEPQNGILWHR